MKILNKTLLLAYLLVVFGSANSLQRASVLVDGSGSMSGFFKTGAIDKVISQIDDFWDGPIDVEIFKSMDGKTIEFSRFASFSRKNFGNYTLLGKAIERKKDAKIVFFITDNISSGEEDTAFFDYLNSPDVSGVWIIPVFKDFDGHIYLPPEDKRSSRDKNFLLPANSSIQFDKSFTESTRYKYKGSAGFLIYVIVNDSSLMNWAYRTDGDDLISTMIQNSGLGEAALVKPIDWRAIVLDAPGKSENIRKSIALYDSLCPANKLGWIPPAGKLVRIKHSPYFFLVTHNKKAFAVPWGANSKITIYFSLGSRMPYVQIGSNENICASEITLDIEPEEPEIIGKNRELLDFMRELVGENWISAKITPNTLAGKLAPAQDDSIDWNPFVYRISIIMKSVPVPFRPDYILKVLLCPTPLLELRFSVIVNIPPGQFSMSDKFFNKYFTYNIYDRTKIFTPQDPIHFLAREPVKIEYKLQSKD